MMTKKYNTLQKGKKKNLPQRHQDTKGSKEFIINNLSLVLPIAIGICAFVPWWQKRYGSGQAGNFKVKLSVFIIIILNMCQARVYSQGTDFSAGKQQHFWMGFSVSPAQTNIMSTGTITIEQLKSTKKTSFSGSIEAGYYFSEFFGISTGLGFGSYLSDLTLDSYDNNGYDTIDADLDTYERFITGTDISERQKISFLTIPVIFNLKIPMNESFGFYIQTGVNFSVPVVKSFSSSGTFTYKGYYQAYNVWITGVPFEGFEEDYKNSIEGDLKIKSFNAELAASAGASFTIQNKVELSLGLLYCKLLSDLSDYDSPGSYRLTSMPDQMRSLMEGSSKTTASSLGLKLSFRYYLK